MKRYSIQTKTTFQFPPAPEGEEWHNPEGATAEEVGVGYRLLTKREREMLANGKLKLDNVSLFNESYSYRRGFGKESQMSGISAYTYRVPDTTPIASGFIEYDSNKFYGLEEDGGERKALVQKHDLQFVVSLNPTRANCDSTGKDTFEGWQKWLKEYHGAEIQAFNSLVGLVQWMDGGK